MHLKHMQIKDLRSIHDMQMDFITPDSKPAESALPNINVLLGENGVGKSTVLRAVALAILAPALEKSSGFVSDGMIRRLPRINSAKQRPNTKSSRKGNPRNAIIAAHVALHLQDVRDYRREADSVEIEFSAEIHSVEDSEYLEWNPGRQNDLYWVLRAQHARRSASFFLVGYGATRRVDQNRQFDPAQRQKLRTLRYERVAGLFEEQHSLIPISAWLPMIRETDQVRYREAVRLINNLLPDACRMYMSPEYTGDGLEMIFSMSGIDVPFRALSDGYRAYVAWVADMLYHLCMSAPARTKLTEMTGVVLIDEIDLHLHPDWQRSVLPTLSSALPKIQFIVTTHSPLVIGSLRRENVQLLEATAAEGTVCKMLPEEVYGRSAEQLLLSPYFGLDTTRAPDVAAKLELLRKRAERGDKNASAIYLKLLANGEI